MYPGEESFAAREYNAVTFPIICFKILYNENGCHFMDLLNTLLEKQFLITLTVYTVLSSTWL